MKEKIEELIKIIKSGDYDNEAVHLEYDYLLEEYILHFDPYIFYIMRELINLKKKFWYA